MLPKTCSMSYESSPAKIGERTFNEEAKTTFP